MTAFTAKSRFTLRNMAPRLLRQHKFAIGQTVALRWPATSVQPKDPKRAQAGSMFEVIRLLPEEGDLFHYRVKSAVTGQERVVAEADLQAEAE